MVPGWPLLEQHPLSQRGPLLSPLPHLHRQHAGGSLSGVHRSLLLPPDGFRIPVRHRVGPGRLHLPAKDPALPGQRPCHRSSGPDRRRPGPGPHLRCVLPPHRRSVQLPDEQPGLQQPAPGPPFWPTAGWSILTCNSRRPPISSRSAPGPTSSIWRRPTFSPCPATWTSKPWTPPSSGWHPLLCLGLPPAGGGAQVHLHPVCPQRGLRLQRDPDPGGDRPLTLPADKGPAFPVKAPRADAIHPRGLWLNSARWRRSPIS